MSFRDAACEYLAKYKVDQLGVEEKGIFPFRGKNISMAHILPIRHSQLNILEVPKPIFFLCRWPHQVSSVFPSSKLFPGHVH